MPVTARPRRRISEEHPLSAPVDALYEWLATAESPGAEHLLAAGLAHAEPEYRERITRLLFNRRTEEAWAALVGNYERLSQAAQATLVADEPLFRGGLTRALERPDALARKNALAALCAHPRLQLAFLLPDVLRDPSDEVRRAAAATFRALAGRLLDQPPPAGASSQERETYAAERAELTKALLSALRAFDLHYRREVIEVSLWLTKDLGAALWGILGNRRSACGSVADNGLCHWNSPRLARFLLEGLAQSGWRVPAQRLLQTWRKPEEVIALLRESEILHNEEIARRLTLLKDPPYFNEFGPQLSKLPPELRVRVPAWVCRLGYPEDKKALMLGRWLDSPDANLRRATEGALSLSGFPADLAKRAGSRRAAGEPVRVQIQDLPAPAAADAGARPRLEAAGAGRVHPATQPAVQIVAAPATDQTGSKREHLRQALEQLLYGEDNPADSHHLLQEVRALLKDLSPQAGSGGGRNQASGGGGRPVSDTSGNRPEPRAGEAKR